MEAIIKVWLVNIEVYNLFFGITKIKQANCTQIFNKKKITINGND